MSELPTELVPLTTEQRDIVDLSRAFAREEIRPRGGFFADPLLALGSAGQKRTWLTPLAGPDTPMTALATTEPGM
ncbi:hypothetical protein [Streptomyces sp. NBC_00191]|uniref:hypothetical protein n=1 Tax=Streptomyces sp. NBC_00191 TaxID=2975674 RepID=UPI00324C43B0